MSGASLDELIRRAKQYESEGYASSHAFGLAAFEARVEQWPAGWGGDFVALVFGDFEAPDQPLVFDQLGITIEPEKLTDTVVRSALTVLKARVAVPEKSLASVRDAVRRLNLLAGLLSYTNQGAPVRWWSYITSPTGGGVSFKLGGRSPDFLLSLLDLLAPDARRKVAAALYWIREPRGMILEHHRADQLAVFAGYWNAFECLVDAAESLVPRTRSTRAAKVAAIRARWEKTAGCLGPGDIADLYREVVDPGLRQKAEHALRVCLGDKLQHYLEQCFDYKPAERALYAIRNAINHGTVDVDDPETAMIIEARFPELWLLVFSMLSGVLHLKLRPEASRA